MLPRCFQDLVGRDHHAQVDHVVVVAAQYHAHNVLPDIVNVAFDRCHQHLRPRGYFAAVLRLLPFNERCKIGHGFLHYTSALHNLRKKHFATSEQIAHHVHSVHQRAFNHMQWAF